MRTNRHFVAGHKTSYKWPGRIVLQKSGRYTHYRYWPRKFHGVSGSIAQKMLEEHLRRGHWKELDRDLEIDEGL